MEASGKLIAGGSTAAAGFVTQALAPHMANLPDLPYGWMAVAAYGGWTAKAAATTLKEGRLGSNAGRARKAQRELARFQGEASTGELWANLSVWAARQHASATRRSLSRKERWRAPGGQVGVPVGRPAAPIQNKVVGPLWGSPEDAYLVLGPTRSGKTGAIGTMVMEAPGACVVTSSRTDLLKYTARHRSTRGRIHVFNPDGMGDIPSDLRWNPVLGCETAQGATQRAGYFMAASSGAGGDDGAYWEDAATEYLKCLLHAAALTGENLLKVYEWAVTPMDQTPLEILASHPGAAEGWDQVLGSLLKTGTGNHISSVISLVKRTLTFLTDPTVRHAVTPPPEESFDVREFIEGNGTLYLIGVDRKGSSTSPYVTCLVSFIYEEGKLLASKNRSNRLDPALTFALDEVTIVAPIPADRWITEAAGWGFTLVFGTQSIAQIYGRWGNEGARTLLDNCTVKIIWGGFTDNSVLEDISRMCGEVDLVAMNGTTTKRRLMPTEAVRLIPKGQGLLLHRRTRPVKIRLTSVWDRPDFAPIDSLAELEPAAARRELLPGPAPAGDDTPTTKEAFERIVASLGTEER